MKRSINWYERVDHGGYAAVDKYGKMIDLKFEKLKLWFATRCYYNH